MTAPVGLLIGSAVPPEHCAELARQAERLGLSELWYSEHYFRSGGLTGAATALAVTDALPVGLGVVAAVARPAPVLAMELATLGRLHPGRVTAGVGAGEGARMAELGLAPASPLRAVRACVQDARALLEGDVVRGVRLAFPAPGAVGFHLGAAGPKMLQLSGAIADGTLLSLVKGPAYVRWAHSQIQAGAAAAGRTDGHRVVSFAAFAVDDDAGRARAAVRPIVAGELANGPSVFTDAHGISAEVAAMLARGGPELLERELPDAWIDELAVAGDPPACAAAIARQLQAGADAVALLPVPVDRAAELLEVLAGEVLPLLSVPSTPRGMAPHAAR